MKKENEIGKTVKFKIRRQCKICGQLTVKANYNLAEGLNKGECEKLGLVLSVPQSKTAHLHSNVWIATKMMRKSVMGT